MAVTYTLEIVEEVILGPASGKSPVARTVNNRDTIGDPETVTIARGADLVAAYVRVKVAVDL